MNHDNSPKHPQRLLSALLVLISGVTVISIAVLLHLAFGHQIRGFSWKKGEVRENAVHTTRILLSEIDSNGIHLPTGLFYAPGFLEIRQNCTACHSPKLITQTAATREGWIQIISWMQRTQGLWDLGENQSIILDYLAEYYAPVEQGRRPNLNPDDIVWYTLEQ